MTSILYSVIEKSSSSRICVIFTGTIFTGERTMSISELFSVADSDQASLCSVSTNATEDNLPGPGRTIGLFYNFAGRHLEVQLGRAAERMGHGSRGAGIMTGNTCTDLGLVSENLEPLLCPSDQASLHSVSTNATADNLPGAGRTLGLFYSFAGKHLEARLGRLAGILGRGPRATALRIQENQGVVALASVLPLPLSPTKARNKKIQKDCKHLLKYVGSNALSTRGQALDLIIDLSLDDHIRNFLKAVGAVHLIEQAHKELFIRSDFDLSLLSRSRKALVTVADDVLMNEIKTIGESEEEALYFRSDKISYYLRDPDRSFIVVRCLVQLFSPHRKDDFFFFQMCQHVFLEHMVIAIETSPEWESVDQLLNNIFVRREDLLWPYFDDFRLIGLALEIALQLVIY
ncbi:hypothetical protein DFH11DRAFT_143274 [Phellopilus nigrolimitatus]|nr:hypothetical protein DFH11DRAFT_143274 [Phellopilus nigrolimitatus]